MSLSVRVLACIVVGVLAAPAAPAAPDIAPAPGSAAVQRLTADQYRNIISDVFGADIDLGGKLEPEVRAAGLAQVGAGQASITAAGFEQYFTVAHAVAAQVVGLQHRDRLIPCKPAAADQPDDACAARFIGETGRLLFRRALTKDEVHLWTSVASASARAQGSFYEGLGFSLAGMLESPHFLFRREVTVRNPHRPGRTTLDGASRASKLSFLLWNAAPDAALLAAAESGRLATDDGWRAEVDRLMASPRLDDGVRAFFSDMLGLSELDNVGKDALIYPLFTREVARDAKEQTLRTIADVIARDGDYREIFTTRRTFLTPALSALYGMGDGGAPGWTPHEYKADDPRAGILTQVSFVALHSHEGRTSSTLRGKAVREVILCQKIPDPPGNVNFDLVQDTGNPKYRTARDRLTAHVTNPVCAGCHKLTDPLGFPLETFNSDGTVRMTENGGLIDTSGVLGAVPFSNTAEFVKTVANDSATSSCLVNRLYAYAMGRSSGPGDKNALAALNESFTKGGHRISGLLRAIALTDRFLEP